jgi:hypothetical protein
VTYSIWKDTSGMTAYSFTSTYHETTDIFGTAGLSNGRYVLLDRAENSTRDVVQTIYFGGAVLFENDIIGDAPDSGAFGVEP